MMGIDKWRNSIYCGWVFRCGKRRKAVVNIRDDKETDMTLAYVNHGWRNVEDEQLFVDSMKIRKGK